MIASVASYAVVGDDFGLVQYDSNAGAIET